jgi:RNA-directed DNA polymerase
VLRLRSFANALLSVRRVTQINAGRNTPGVDMLVVKTSKARSELVDQMRSYQPWKARPARRVYIPKGPKGGGKKRPLSIPTIHDRAMQAIVKNALEPYWEARFEPASYGFRPGRGCHDAIAKIFSIARPNKRKKWVLDADIEGAFDSISHERVLQTIGPFPARELIRRWLKAGYVQMGTLHQSEAGVPQGSIIGPLLMNIALHGMEDALGVRYDKRGQIRGSRALVRYADDWVLFCESEQDARAARRQAQKWLLERGLLLSEEKTRIAHLSEGFDFLGFNVRHYPAPNTSRSGYKLLIKPSKESVSNFKERIRHEWKDLNGHSAMEVLKRLNPIVRGWANYFRIGVSKHTFETLDYWIFDRCVRHVRSNHSRKGWRWCRQKYWGRLNPERADRWVFGDKSFRSLPPEALLDAHKEARARKGLCLTGRSRPQRLLARARTAKARRGSLAAQPHGPGPRPAGTLQPLRGFPVQRRSPKPPPPAPQSGGRNRRTLQPEAATPLLPPADPRSSIGKKTFGCESELLEPCARKPASTVLRGEWRSDAPFLPDSATSDGPGLGVLQHRRGHLFMTP